MKPLISNKNHMWHLKPGKCHMCILFEFIQLSREILLKMAEENLDAFALEAGPLRGVAVLAVRGIAGGTVNLLVRLEVS
jgi:hypothetical protein